MLTCRKAHEITRNVRSIHAEAQREHLTETFLSFLHLLNCWNSRSTTMQPRVAWSEEQLCVGRLESGFVRYNNPARSPKKELKQGASKTQTNEQQRVVCCGRVSHVVWTRLVAPGGITMERCRQRMKGRQRNSSRPRRCDHPIVLAT